MPENPETPKPPMIPGLDYPTQQLRTGPHESFRNFTPEETERANQWLKNWKEPVCPYCGKGDWLMNSTFLQVHPMPATHGALMNWASVPLIQITCRTDACGYVMLINALASGIMKAGKEKKDAD